jgi:hypothetical protein
MVADLVNLAVADRGRNTAAPDEDGVVWLSESLTG